MKLSASVGIGILTLLLGVPAAVFAQDEPKQDEPKQEEPKPETKHQDEAKPPKQEKVKPSKEQENGSKAAESSGQMEQGQAGKPSGKSGHIPDNQFKAHFGRSHTFTVQRTTVSGGQAGFVYGGYTFVIVDVWPAGWAYTDQCYIDYVDGEYVLFDLAHPGISIALTVVL
jgi:hypothetical protein